MRQEITVFPFFQWIFAKHRLLILFGLEYFPLRKAFLFDCGYCVDRNN